MDEHGHKRENLVFNSRQKGVLRRGFDYLSIYYRQLKPRQYRQAARVLPESIEQS